MNYTKPNNTEHNDKPSDWLNSALIFAGALGHILKETEGVVIDVKGDINLEDLMSDNCEKLFVYKSEGQIHIKECWDDISAGTMVWIHDTEWYCQYLEDESMWYLTEHGDDGLEGEFFFDKYDDLTKFVKDNNITLDFDNLDYDLTTLERWDLLKKYHSGVLATIPWDRMALPNHRWFDEYTTFYIPKYKRELSKGEIEYLETIEEYREEDKKLREQKKKDE